MDRFDELNEKLRAFCKAELQRSDMGASELARRSGKNVSAFLGWLSGGKPSHLISTSLIVIFRYLGHDIMAWLERRQTPSPELRDYLEAPRMADDIAEGLIDPDEIEALRALDQLDCFKGRSPRQIETEHIHIRILAKRGPKDVPK